MVQKDVGRMNRIYAHWYSVHITQPIWTHDTLLNNYCTISIVIIKDVKVCIYIHILKYKVKDVMSG